MTRINTKSKKSIIKNKFFMFPIMFLAILILICGIQSAYAYYYKEDSLPILSSLVGDFDLGDGDINIIIFKETTVDSEEFVKTYAIPAVGYSFNQNRTTCQSPSHQKVICEKDNPNVDCHYTYNEDTKDIELTSNQKVTCKFYFEKDYNNDIELYIMMQDTNGTHSHKDKMYRNVDNIPAYGFTFSEGECENGSTVELDPETGKIKVTSSQKDICYAYYDGNLQNADIIMNVYAQKVVGGEYTKINTINTSKKYKLNDEQTKCKKQDENQTLSEIKPTYSGGFIELPETTEKLICDAYLDIDSGAE